MMEVALHIPDDVAKQMRRVNEQDIARHILEEYAIRAYQERTLGESHLRRLLGFETRDELEEFFAAHLVYRNYTLEDLEQDRRTAQQLGL
jgi:hypothetical protein